MQIPGNRPALPASGERLAASIRVERRAEALVGDSRSGSFRADVEEALSL